MKPLFPERYTKSVKIIGYITILATIIIFVLLVVKIGWKALPFIPLALLAMLFGVAFASYRLPCDDKNDNNNQLKEKESPIKDEPKNKSNNERI